MSMSSFCEPMRSQYSDDYKAFTDAELLAEFPGKGILSLMTSSENDANRSSDGLLNVNFVDEYIKKLKNQQIIPIPPEKSDDTVLPKYMADDEALMNIIRREYCYYETRYFYAIDRLITSLKDGFLTNDQRKRDVVQGQLENSRKLNMKINDLIQITNRITRSRLEQSQSYNQVINQLNADMDKRSAKYQAQAKILNDEQATAMLHKEMVKYTEEKNRANSNLLSLYSFLNVFALGMLFYIYRAT